MGSKKGRKRWRSFFSPSLPLLRARPVKAIADSFDRLPVQVDALVMVMKFLVHWDFLSSHFCWHLLARPVTGHWTWQLPCSKLHASSLHVCLQCVPLHFRSQVPLMQVCVHLPLLHFRLHVPCSLLQVCSQFDPSHFRWQLSALHICKHLCPWQVSEHCLSVTWLQLKVLFVWLLVCMIPLPEKEFNDFMKI